MKISMSISGLNGRSIASNTFSNLIAQIIPIAIAILCIPTVLSGFGVDRLGVISLAWAIVGYFSVLDLGLGRTLTYFLAKKSKNYISIYSTKICWLSISLISMLGLLTSLLIFCLTPRLINSVFSVPMYLRSEALYSFYILSFSIPFVILSSGLRGVLEGFHQFHLINLVRIPMSVLTFSSPIFFMHYSKSIVFPIAFIVFIRVFTTFIFLTYALKLLPWQKPDFSRREKLGIIHMFRFGGWLTISNIIGPIMTFMDKFLVGIILNTAAIAYYATPYEMVTKLWIFPIALTTVLFPSFSWYKDDIERSRRLLFTSLKLITFSVFLPVLFLTSFSSEILSFWITPAFSEQSSSVLGWLAIGVFFNCIAQVLSTYIQSLGRADITAKFHVIELILYLPLVLYTTKTLGIFGTALCWTGRVFLDCLLLTKALKLLSNIDILSGKHTFILLFLTTMLLSFLLAGSSNAKSILCVIVLVLSLPFFWFFLFDQFEKQFILYYLKRKTS